MKDNFYCDECGKEVKDPFNGTDGGFWAKSEKDADKGNVLILCKEHLKRKYEQIS
jgi:hypothetical protein